MLPKINKTVLIAPLDWGLGHATRCIPIIRHLEEKGCRILLAASGLQADLLQKEFPEIKILQVKGYNISYPVNKDFFSLKIAAQVPKIMRTISYEHKWLREAVKEHKIDAVISDNRYGMYHEKIPSVFITHQLAVKSGMNNIIDKFLLKQNKKYINRFNECWVPDMSDENNLAGELSHPKNISSKIRYIGWLSRMDKVVSEKDPIAIGFDIACILSGPEPQRTLLEEKVLKQLNSFNGKAVLVRGVSTTQPFNQSTTQPITIFNQLSGNEISNIICKSKLVICRSGYSSVMDLVKLQQKAILIPTPGQTEQEYLSKYLMQRKIFLSFDQNEFDLQTAVDAAKRFPFLFPGYKEGYKNAINDLLKII